MKPTIFLYCLLLLLVAGCSATEETDAGADALGQPAALSLATIHTNGADSDGPATRAATDLPTATSVGFFVQADAAHGYATAINNREGKYDGAGEKPRNLWLPTDSIWLNNHDADVAIYAPYDAAQSDVQTGNPGKLKLTAALRLDDDKDLWCKRLKVNNRTQKEAPATLTPTLEHVYTRLTITFVKDAGYAAPDKIVSLVLAGTDICDAAIYDPFADSEEPVYTPVTPGNGFTATPAAPLLIGTDATATDAAKVDLLLIPVKLTKTITLTADVSGEKMPLSIPNTKFGGELAAGKQYQAKVNLKAGKLELSSVQIIDWGTTTLDDANLKPMPTPTPTEPGPVMIDGLEWSAYNCDGKGGVVEKPWEYGAYYAFEEGDGTGGNRCPTGYRQPTDNELQKLIDKKAPAGVVFKINGKNYTTNSLGFVGKDLDPNSGLVVIEGDNILFLPATGYQFYTDVTEYAGNSGSYWSRTSTGFKLNYLHFAAQWCEITDSSNSYKYTVRCVKGSSAP